MKSRIAVTNLIDEEHVGGAVPSPFIDQGLVLVEAFLSHLARTDAAEHAEEGACARASIEPYCEQIRLLPRLDEPEEEICWVVAGDVDPASVLLLGFKGCFACVVGDPVAYCDVVVDGRADCSQIDLRRGILRGDKG